MTVETPAGPDGIEFAFPRFDAGDERRREALFLLGNGSLSVRASSALAPADAWHYPGVYRVGLYDRQPSRIENETVWNTSLVNLPDGFALRVRRVGGEALLMAGQGELLDYRHAARLADATSRRCLHLRDADGGETRIGETRLVSMARPWLAALRVEIEPVNWSGALALRSLIDADTFNDGIARYGRYTQHHLAPPRVEAHGEDTLLLRTRTLQSGIDIAVAVRTRVVGARRAGVDTGARHVALDFVRDAPAGEPVVVDKLVAVVTALDTDEEPGAVALRELAHADAASFDAAYAAHARAWARRWAGVGIATADRTLTRLLHLHAWHLLQVCSDFSAGADAGFTGRGWNEAYQGHAFWEDSYAFPLLADWAPEGSGALLRYRARRLDAARAIARAHGWRGAVFPWRSAADGSEETPRFQPMPYSGRWARDYSWRQRHMGAAIALNAWRQYAATGDRGFLATVGAPLMLEIARGFASMAEPDDSGRHHIRGVCGPDEFHTGYPGRPGIGIDDTRTPT